MSLVLSLDRSLGRGWGSPSCLVMGAPDSAGLEAGLAKPAAQSTKTQDLLASDTRPLLQPLRLPPLFWALTTVALVLGRYCRILSTMS